MSTIFSCLFVFGSGEKTELLFYLINGLMWDIIRCNMLCVISSRWSRNLLRVIFITNYNSLRPKGELLRQM